jgi:hypothetical protein
MPEIIDLKKARMESATRKGFRNWVSRFEEDFSAETRLNQVSLKTLSFLAQGKDETMFYLYDLIMNLEDLGSGFEFRQLDGRRGMEVMDRYLFLLDRIRFEYMKRLGWLQSYPGEEFTLVELIMRFDRMALSLQAKPPLLSPEHPAYQEYCNMDPRERQEFIRKLIPKALKKIQSQSTTL